MKKAFRIAAGMCVLWASTLLFAQAQSAGGNLAEIHTNRIKPGMTAQYEAARKKHMGWHRSQNDAWSWLVYEILTGDHTGSYVVGTFGHNWKDLDAREKFNESDSADAIASMGPYMAGEETSYSLLRPDLSLAPTPSGPPAPLVTVTHFLLNPDGRNDFMAAVKQVNAGITKSNFPVVPSRWFELVNGGHSPHFVLVGDRANWAAFQPTTDKTLDDMMADVYGKDQGAAILNSLRKSAHMIYTETLRYRSDLSYTPGK
ncbi:MAG: hypothetical protein JOY79_10440 [Acidobacteriaceae bacterium]|nr:hypothetical protein [Acidobacteriaceae bacterium]